jgi:hypothetical protein
MTGDRQVYPAMLYPADDIDSSRTTVIFLTPFSLLMYYLVHVGYKKVCFVLLTITDYK